MSLSFPNTEIDSIPYRQLIEVPFSVTTTGNCLNYVDVQLLIHSTCESTDTYQYGVTVDSGEVAVDYTTVNSMASSAATFSVSWKTSAGTLSGTASSSSDGATKTSENFNEMRIFAIILIVSQIITIICISAGLWKMFNILNSTDQVPREKPLYDFYESKPEDIQGSNEQFTNSTGSRKLTILSSKNPSSANDLHISIKQTE